MSRSLLDPAQITQEVYDDTNKALQVNLVAGTVSATNPSVGTDGAAAPTSSTQVAGQDGSGNLQPITVTASGLKVDGSGVTQPVSAASLPLPTGAATAANQSTANTSLASIDGKLTDTVNGLKVDGSSVTQPVSAASLPLPTGAATSANQTTANTSLSSIDGKLSTTVNGLKVDGSAVTQPVSAASLPLPTGAATAAKQPALGTAGTASTDVITVQGIASMTALKVDGSATTQPVSGTITANIGTTNGLALDSSLSTIDTDIKASQPRKIQDGSGNALTSQVNGTQRALDVGINVAGAQVDPRQIRALTSSDVVSAAQSGTWNINNVSGTVSLPTGAATSAKQPALGTAGTAASDVITIQGIAGMTAIKVDGSAVTQPVSGTITANIGTTNGLALDSSLSTIDSDIKASQPRKLQDGSGNAITSVANGSNRGIHSQQLGFTNASFVRNDYTITSVTTSAYTQLVASTANDVQEIHISDTSGQTLKLATGGSGSEVDKIIIPPGGTYPIKLYIASGTRISIKAVSATANTGEIDIQLLG